VPPEGPLPERKIDKGGQGRKGGRSAAQREMRRTTCGLLLLAQEGLFVQVKLKLANNRGDPPVAAPRDGARNGARSAVALLGEKLVYLASKRARVCICIRIRRSMWPCLAVPIIACPTGI